MRSIPMMIYRRISSLNRTVRMKTLLLGETPTCSINEKSLRKRSRRTSISGWFSLKCSSISSSELDAYPQSSAGHPAVDRVTFLFALDISFSASLFVFFLSTEGDPSPDVPPAPTGEHRDLVWCRVKRLLSLNVFKASPHFDRNRSRRRRRRTRG